MYECDHYCLLYHDSESNSLYKRCSAIHCEVVIPQSLANRRIMPNPFITSCRVSPPHAHETRKELLELGTTGNLMSHDLLRLGGIGRLLVDLHGVVTAFDSFALAFLLELIFALVLKVDGAFIG